MRLDNSKTSSPMRGRRGVAVLISTGTVLGSLVLGAAPALANDTTRHVAPDGKSVTFATHDSSRGVDGDITFTVRQDGNWEIDANGHNSHLIGRNVHWTCRLSWDASEVQVSTGKKWVPGKKARSVDAKAYNPFVQAGYAVIVERGTANCDIVIG